MEQNNLLRRAAGTSKEPPLRTHASVVVLGIAAVAPLPVSVTGYGSIGKYIRAVLLPASVTGPKKY